MVWDDIYDMLEFLFDKPPSVIDVQEEMLAIEFNVLAELEK